MPLLLIFLGVGMLAGEDGPGRIQFSDFQTAFLIGSLALAIILLDGDCDVLVVNPGTRRKSNRATLGKL